MGSEDNTGTSWGWGSSVLPGAVEEEERGCEKLDKDVSSLQESCFPHQCLWALGDVVLLFAECRVVTLPSRNIFRAFRNP